MDSFISVRSEKNRDHSKSINQLTGAKLFSIKNPYVEHGTQRTSQNSKLSTESKYNKAGLFGSLTPMKNRATEDYGKFGTISC
jgi:hypothetical protein